MERIHDRRFGLYSFCVIFLFAVILIFRWKWMPTFIDIYYHLLTTLNFDRAAGWPAISLWEYAPFGRPHLYPPLLHILMLIIFKLNVNILTVARVFEFASFPLVLSIIFLTIKRMFNARLAFWSVLIAASMYSFYLSCVDFLAASLAFCLGMLAFSSLEKKRLVAATIFMTLCLYSHVSISLFFVLSFLFYGLIRRERLKFTLIATIGAGLMYLPLLVHQLNYLRFVDLTSLTENFPFEINIIVYLLAGFGIYLAAKGKKEYLFFIAIAFATAPFLFLRYRFLSGQGMIGIIFLASLALDFFYAKLYSLAIEKRRFKPISIYLTSVFLGLFLLSPSITVKGPQIGLSLFGSTYINIFPTNDLRARANEISIYMPKSFQPIFDIVRRETKPDDLITSNFEYLAGFISTFTGRATSSAMLKEVRPFRQVNHFQYAKLIIWLKDPERLNWQPLGLIKGLGLIKEAETEIFFIYKNPNADISARFSKASVPFGVCVLTLFLLSIIAAIDLARKEN